MGRLVIGISVGVALRSQLPERRLDLRLVSVTGNLQHIVRTLHDFGELARLVALAQTAFGVSPQASARAPENPPKTLDLCSAKRLYKARVVSLGVEQNPPPGDTC